MNLIVSFPHSQRDWNIAHFLPQFGSLESAIVMKRAFPMFINLVFQKQKQCMPTKFFFSSLATCKGLKPIKPLYCLEDKLQNSFTACHYTTSILWCLGFISILCHTSSKHDHFVPADFICCSQTYPAYTVCSCRLYFQRDAEFSPNPAQCLRYNSYPIPALKPP